jgi:hypothetical protein
VKAEASPKWCVKHPGKAIYDEGVLGEDCHRHAGGVYGFFDCDGETALGESLHLAFLRKGGGP